MRFNDVPLRIYLHTPLFNVAWLFTLVLKYTRCTPLQTFQHQTLGCFFGFACTFTLCLTVWEVTARFRVGESEKFKEQLWFVFLVFWVFLSPSAVLSLTELHSELLRTVDKTFRLPVERSCFAQYTLFWILIPVHLFRSISLYVLGNSVGNDWESSSSVVSELVEEIEEVPEKKQTSEWC